MMNNNEHKARIMADLFMLAGVPYEMSSFEGFTYRGQNFKQIQFKFSWCEGDVIMYPCDGTEVEYSHIVESYGFPWDEEDISREYPEEMAWRIIAYYFDVPFEIE